MQRFASPVSLIHYTVVNNNHSSNPAGLGPGPMEEPKMNAARLLVTEDKRDGTSDGDSSRSIDQFSRPHYIWWYETVGCAFFISAFIGIIATVWSFDNRPLPHWPFELSINTFIAAFSVLLKTSAGLVLAEGISHIKWTSLRGPQTLRSFTVHDDASRGPWGAVALLWNDKGRHISSLGALVILLILFMEPFTQQIVSFYDCVEVEPNLVAEIPRSNYFDPPLGYSPGQSMAGTIPWEMRSYINQGLFATNQHQLRFSCPSGNCTFGGTYSSLAFCSVCEDVSSKLLRVPWPAGSNVTTMPANITLTGLGLGFADLTLEPLTENGSLEDQRRALAAQGWPSIAAIRMIDDKTYVAHSCNISACMQTYKAQVRRNILDETVVSEYIIPLTLEYGVHRVADLDCVEASAKRQLSEMGYDLSLNQRWMSYNVKVRFISTKQEPIYEGDCRKIPADKIDKFCDKSKRKTSGNYFRLTDEAAQLVPAECVYSMSQAAPSTLRASVFRGMFKGELVEWGRNDPPALFGPEPLLAMRFAGSGNGTLQDMSDLMRNVSAGLTKYVRQKASGNLSRPKLGTVTHNTVCIRVKWPWVAFSGLIVLLTLVFFIYVVVKSRGDQAELRNAYESEGIHAPFYDFKSSALALLFHGLDDASRRELLNVGSTNRTAEMIRRSHDIKIQLVATEKGWKLATTS